MAESGKLVQLDRLLLQRKKHYILDFDGTLADTTHAHAEAYRRVFSQFGVDVDYTEVAGLATDAAVRKIIEKFQIVLKSTDVNSLVVQKQTLAREILPRSVSWFDGVQDFFLWAKKTEKILSLVTSASRATLDVALKNLPDAPSFHACLTGNDVASGKPDPEGFLLAIQSSSASVGECIVIEDSEAGLAAAARAGVDRLKVFPSMWREIAEMTADIWEHV